VAATRWPTYFDRFKASALSTTWIDAERFVRNPDFQLRARGAFAPAVSFSQNESSPPSRQPLMVTTPGAFRASVPVVGSACGADVTATLTAAFDDDEACEDREVIADALVADCVAAVVESD